MFHPVMNHLLIKKQLFLQNKDFIYKFLHVHSTVNKFI